MTYFLQLAPTPNFHYLLITLSNYNSIDGVRALTTLSIPSSPTSKYHFVEKQDFYTGSSCRTLQIQMTPDGLFSQSDRSLTLGTPNPAGNKTGVTTNATFSLLHFHFYFLRPGLTF